MAFGIRGCQDKSTLIRVGVINYIKVCRNPVSPELASKVSLMYDTDKFLGALASANSRGGNIWGIFVRHKRT